MTDHALERTSRYKSQLMNVTNESTPVFRGEKLSRSFGDVPVLTDVDISVMRNHVIGIVGENGAGKTTLFNIISGVLPPDGGFMELKGEPFKPASYRDASTRGISRVFQEQALIPNIRVYENLLLSHETMFTRWGQLVDKKRMVETAQRVIDQANLDFDVRRVTDSYSFSKRQLIEIARACIVPTEILGIDHPVVLLDEPTSALEKSDEETFRNMINHLRNRASIVFVSHRLTEVLELSDVIYVLKDGKLVAQVRPGDVDEKTLHGLMVGRERESDYYYEADQLVVDDSAPVALSVRNLSRHGRYENISIDLRCGEVVGIGGLLNSGKSEFGKGVAGIIPPDAGTVALQDGEPEFPVIRNMTRRGLGYVPAERLREGMIGAFSVSWNLSLAGGMDTFANRIGIWRRTHEIRVTEEFIKSMSIKARGPHDVCSRLSGGNQQKVVLARWLCRSPRVLILDNPTRGVDAGAKEEIYSLLRQLSARGVAILLITDDLLELIGLSNRVIVMQHGRIASDIAAPSEAKPTERDMVAAMLVSPDESMVARKHQGMAS
jgi:ribose transport system ATP-binding protein